MPIVYTLPYQFVDMLISPGIHCSAGVVPLKQYLCKTEGNGGADNALALLGAVRWMKDGGSGPILNTLVGGERMDILQKGQGRPEDFRTVFDFLTRNRLQLKNVKLNVIRRSGKGGQTVETLKSGNVHDLYFKDNSPEMALRMMVRDRFFGLDCIGFVANWMIHVGLWDKYYGTPIDSWKHVFKKPINKVEEIEPLNILIWPGSHIAIVDWCYGNDGRLAWVDVCQSSSGGPQCNLSAIVQATGTKIGGQMLFKVYSSGAPAMPVTSQFLIYGMPGLAYEQPYGAPLGY